MKATDSDKHSSLLRRGINYGRKKFYDIVPGASIAQFDRNQLRVYISIHGPIIQKKITAVIYNVMPFNEMQRVTFCPLCPSLIFER
jgi:hypothetical protein